MADAAPSRLFFLDWLRIAAFALLVPYHVGMAYVSWPWHVKSMHAGPAIEPLMRLTSPWRLDLLFLVSGVATSFMLRRPEGIGRFLRRRAARLLLPLAFGMLVIVPPQSYVEVVRQHGYTGSYLDFMGLYLTGYHGFCHGRSCLALPTWNHLWFLPYLFAYTAALCGVLSIRPDALQRTGAVLDRRFAGTTLFVLPIAVLALTRAWLQPVFPETHAFVDDPFGHLQHGAMFALGAALAGAPSVWPRFDAARWPALAAAIAAWAVLVGLAPPAGLPRALLYSVQQWCAITAAIGFAHRHLDLDGPWRRTLAVAVFPVYVLHQTVIVLLVATVARWSWPPRAEGLAVLVLTVAIVAAAYRLVRDIAVLRPLVGFAP